ncbi:hypothetical protein GCM10010452_04490 [Crossiella cryophila]
MPTLPNLSSVPTGAAEPLGPMPVQDALGVGEQRGLARGQHREERPNIHNGLRPTQPQCLRFVHIGQINREPPAIPIQCEENQLPPAQGLNPIPSTVANGLSITPALATPAPAVPSHAVRATALVCRTVARGTRVPAPIAAHHPTAHHTQQPSLAHLSGFAWLSCPTQVPGLTCLPGSTQAPSSPQVPHRRGQCHRHPIPHQAPIPPQRQHRRPRPLPHLRQPIRIAAVPARAVQRESVVGDGQVRHEMAPGVRGR